MKGFYIILIILLVILFGPTILKYLGKLFLFLFDIISKTGYKGVL